MGLQMCMTFKSSMKGHTVIQHVIIYICMQKYPPIHFGYLVILLMVEVIIIIVSYDNVTGVLSVSCTYTPSFTQSRQRPLTVCQPQAPSLHSLDVT